MRGLLMDQARSSIDERRRGSRRSVGENTAEETECLERSRDAQCFGRAMSAFAIGIKIKTETETISAGLKVTAFKQRLDEKRGSTS